MKYHTITISILIVLVNCSTPYQPKGALGGYSSNRLEENTFKVEFKGNQHTKAEIVFQHLERRCAEIAVENGFDYFVVYEDSSYLDDIIIEEDADLDSQIDAFQDPRRTDNYLLDRKPVITRDRIEVILRDHHSRISRTYGHVYIDSETTNVVGIYKILLENQIIENIRDYYFPAKEILKKYNK